MRTRLSAGLVVAAVAVIAVGALFAVALSQFSAARARASDSAAQGELRQLRNNLVGYFEETNAWPDALEVRPSLGEIRAYWITAAGKSTKAVWDGPFDGVTVTYARNPNGSCEVRTSHRRGKHEYAWRSDDPAHGYRRSKADPAALWERLW